MLFSARVGDKTAGVPKFTFSSIRPKGSNGRRPPPPQHHHHHTRHVPRPGPSKTEAGAKHLPLHNFLANLRNKVAAPVATNATESQLSTGNNEEIGDLDMQPPTP